ncbi:MAG: hypothetical protein Q8Q18_02375 [bacterium]|nr:hypothetical protein [bacterium]
MSIDEREFRRLAEMVKDNNKMLHKIRRNAAVGTTMRAVYYFVILGFAVGSYYYLQPIIQIGKDSFGNILDSISSIRQAADGFSNIGGIDVNKILGQ